jgi:hypothetical protein
MSRYPALTGWAIAWRPTGPLAERHCWASQQWHPARRARGRGISLAALSQSSSASDARDQGKLIDFHKLDRYFALQTALLRSNHQSLDEPYGRHLLSSVNRN